MKIRRIPPREYGFMLLYGLASVADGIAVFATAGHVMPEFALTAAKWLAVKRLTWKEQQP